MTNVLKIAVGSIVVGLVVLALKLLAWWLTGSVALLSDALESTVNVATAFAALIAIRVAARPADAGHPYGHHKAEFFSAVLEGVMIILAALLIMREAYLGFRNPPELDAPFTGMAINAMAGVMNAIWCRVLISRGGRLKSPALVADGKHLLTDVITSGAVLLGVALAVMTGWTVLDPLLAGLVGLNILWSGWKLTASSLSGLMDEAVSDDTLNVIRGIISDRATGAIEAHDLRTRHAGRVTFIDFHLVVDGQTTVDEAHGICDRIEQSLHAKLPEAQITIHVEPEHMAKHSGVLVL
ncbi:cation diffusion facilitator family transporter [Paracoccus saliphilus]|uniref:Protein p34 n=1 Tax=Paracoccus saliphilus TaxID=405559 RepID=A0AA46A5W3_9RHOB|nr:cation diffusion facilitator family transporter [Paracoccus saliphilus]WCR04648.1 cation transporter [Paracoccus saliphilus]SIS87942.1 cation diffusion facilitator family transporter [Paracoccus saliphilus]